MTRRETLLGLVVVGLSLVVGVALFSAGLEAWLRLTTDPWRPPHPGIYQESDVTGYAYRPGLSFDVNHAEFTNQITVNQWGYRGGRETVADQTPVARRIMVLGDSYMFGLSIPDADLFANRLDAALPDTGVWNVAAAGWGTRTQVAAARQMMPIVRPHLILVAFYENDFFNNVQPDGAYMVAGGYLLDRYCPNTDRPVDAAIAERAIAAFKEGRLTLDQARRRVRNTCQRTPTGLAAVKAWLRDQSRAYAVIVDALHGAAYGLADGPLGPLLSPILPRRPDERPMSGFPPLKAKHLEATREAFRQLKDLCADAGCAVGAMLIPSKASLQVADQGSGPYVDAAAGLLRDLDIPHIDLADPLRAAGGPALYWKLDGHLRPSGHRLMADVVSAQPWVAGR